MVKPPPGIVQAVLAVGKVEWDDRRRAGLDDVGQALWVG